MVFYENNVNSFWSSILGTPYYLENAAWLIILEKMKGESNQMHIKFQVHHTYGLAYEQTFTLQELGLEHIPLHQVRKDNVPLAVLIGTLLDEWVANVYYHGDALPSWKVVEMRKMDKLQIMLEEKQLIEERLENVRGYEERRALERRKVIIASAMDRLRKEL